VLAANPMAVLMVGADVVARTSVKKGTFNPTWRELFSLDVCHDAQRLTLRIYDNGLFEDHVLGQVSFSVAQLLQQSQGASGVQGEFQLVRRRKLIENLDTYAGAWTEDRKAKRERRKTSKYGWISFRLRFTPATVLISRQLNVYTAKKKNPKIKEKKLVEQYHPNVVQNTYFRAHRGDHYILYQGTHQPGLVAQLPDILLDAETNSVFSARSYWSDLYAALSEAEHFICISGWAINPHLRLIRTGPDHESRQSLGQLLKDKADNGCLVFITVWDDPSAPDSYRIGLNGTLNEKVVEYFDHSKVICVRVSRSTKRSDKLRVGADGTSTYLHGQKAIIMDIKPSNAARLQIKHRRHRNSKIQAVGAFVGSMDLTNGRFDDPDKTLFGSLKRAHKNDFYQPCLPAAVTNRNKGPRLPWHDVSARITGAGAVDVLKNFIERWHRQVGSHRFSTQQTCCTGNVTWAKHGYKMRELLKLLKNSPGESALPQSFLDEAKDHIVGRAETVLRLGDSSGNTGGQSAASALGLGRGGSADDADDDDDDDLSDMSEEELQDLQNDLDELIEEERQRSGSWNATFSTDSKQNADKVVQVLRSIDEDCARLDKRVHAPVLMFDKDLKIDNSLHRALVHHIRNAQHFVYLETEHFIGSSHLWSEEKASGANNLVPGEIAAKICAKVAAEQPFHAYIVVPLFPLGLPGSREVQQRLRWQHLTVQMVYRRIAAAIEAAGLEESKTASDYFSFLFLGNREAAEAHKRGNDADADEAADSAEAATALATQVESGDREDYAAAARRVAASRRFQVYVHSNVLIVDDHVALLGSGSVQQRSLAGNRDTELGVSIFEASKLATATETPRGQVYGFRMSLWSEHLGPDLVEQEDFDATVLQHPGSEACANLVQRLARENWTVFARNEGGDEDNVGGHMMRYPYEVEPDGTVLALPDHDSFPDFEMCGVLGSRSINPAFSTL